VPAAPDWAAIDGLRQGLSVPVLLKGIMTPAEAKLALQHGVQGIIVSSWNTASKTTPILALASIVDAVAGKVPVLLDGSVRVGADVVKALAFGAKAVLVSRPAIWALAAYGADGVRTMVEMLQTELGRAMGMMGNPTPTSLTRKAVKAVITPAMIGVGGRARARRPTLPTIPLSDRFVTRGSAVLRSVLLLVALQTGRHPRLFHLLRDIHVLDWTVARVARDLAGGHVCLVGEEYVAVEVIKPLPGDGLCFLVVCR
jgi:hypothetical protein